jgi:serine/threonine protein kinase
VKFSKHQETGRSCVGDGATIVEFTSTTGILANAIVFDSASSLLFGAIASAYDFLNFPMVHGLCELIDTSEEDNAVLYQTGPVRTVAELLTMSARGKKKVSRKAVAELCLLTGLILIESSENGYPMGVTAHGDLRPERIVISAGGDLSIIGYGLPNPAVISWRQEDGDAPISKLLTYAPPERFDETPEDARSDVYSLALIAAEIILGAPVLTGTFSDVQAAVQSGLPAATITKKKKQIGAPFADLLCAALATDPDDRISPEQFVETARQLVEGVQGGDSLATAFIPLFSARTGKAIKATKPDAPVAPKADVDSANEIKEERFSSPSSKATSKLQKPKETINLKEAPLRPTRKDDANTDTETTARPKRKSPVKPESNRPKRSSAKEEAPKKRRTAAKEKPPEEVAAEAPKKRRTAAKEKPPEEVAAEAPKRRRTAAKEKPPEEVAAEAPKRRRTAAKEKLPEEVAAEAPKRRRVTASADDASDESPRRRRRAVSQDEEEETPAPKRRRRS